MNRAEEMFQNLHDIAVLKGISSGEMEIRFILTDGKITSIVDAEQLLESSKMQSSTQARW